MSFREIQIKRKYRSSDCPNIGKEFISKVLDESVLYYRAVGFFSSSSLIHTSKGLLQVAKHYKPGKESVIKFVVSPKLDEKDIEAIKKGYKSKAEVIESAMLKQFSEPRSNVEAERLNILCHLIASGAMDIKVAVTEFSNDDIGMYHEKIGIFKDEKNNYVAFSGSLNESDNAFTNNFESVLVFKSWDPSTELDVTDTQDDFEKLWNNKTERVAIYSFPRAVEKKLFKYKRATYDKHIDDDKNDDISVYTNVELPFIDKNILPTFPYDYQKNAIQNWFKNKCVGIFEMATGTGKTYTGYGAMVKLLEAAKYHLATIIICPFQHLVEQWIEDSEPFHINHIIVGYSAQKYAGYLSKLKNTIKDFNDGLIPYFYFVTTNSSYKLQKVQDELKKIKGPVLFVADEAHNLGSIDFSGKFIDNFRFRLALSATFDRYRDEEGTKRLYNYFGKKCIEYPLEQAIHDKKLTKYYYYPILCYLNNDERKEYLELTKEIKKHVRLSNGKGSKIKLTKTGEYYALKRARIISSSSSKMSTFKSEVAKHRNDNFMLVYCGTSKIESDDDEKEIKQIDEITSYLGNSLNMQIDRYTSRESVEERQIIRNNFKEGKLQALVAIKCLDEGVNIPGIKKAFILASSTNPREYIQRRGRLLRTAPGKQYSEIYDFICLPLKLDEIKNYSKEEIKDFRALINNEVTRIDEFGKHSINNATSNELIENIKEEYGLYEFENDALDDIEWLMEDET